MRRTLAGLLAVCGLVVALAAPAAADDGEDHAVDETHLPVGETVTKPTVGAFWACQTQFNTNAPGAGSEGPWFNGDGTWDSTAKTTVDGSVEWPDAELEVTRDGDTRVITTTDLPTDHATGEFPISSSDDAYAVDRNPNSIAAQDFSFELPAEPELADEPSCVGGEAGILKSGVLLFSPIDAGGRDAVAYEVQDDCDGHPQMSSAYHYHSVSSCVIEDLDSGTGHSKLVGWAFDGFGIYGMRGEDGEELVSADLDECHGHTHTVKFNGEEQSIYHYHATVDYPYVIGCYRGTAATNGVTGPETGQPGQPTGQTGQTGQTGTPTGMPSGAPTGPPPGPRP
jgi:hypothetical protein